MNWQHGFDGLQFDNDRVLNEKIEAIATIQDQVLVTHGNDQLRDDIQVAEPKLVNQARAICRFQESRSQAFVNLDRSLDDQE